MLQCETSFSCFWAFCAIPTSSLFLQKIFIFLQYIYNQYLQLVHTIIQYRLLLVHTPSIYNQFILLLQITGIMQLITSTYHYCIKLVHTTSTYNQYIQLVHTVSNTDCYQYIKLVLTTSTQNQYRKLVQIASTKSSTYNYFYIQYTRNIKNFLQKQ